MKSRTIWIRECHIIDPVSGRDEIADILIQDGMITSVAKTLTLQEMMENVRIVDGKALTAIPGLMDTHVHFRDPGFTAKEDLVTGSEAAVRGGFTHVVCMANTNPVVDEPAVLKDILRRGAETKVHLMQASAVTKGLKGKELVDFEAMMEAGAPIFTDDGIPLMDEAILLDAMSRLSKLGAPISLHEEDPLFVPGAGVNAGDVAKQLGYAGAFAAAEEIMVARDCILALHTGACVCIQHISSGRSVEIVRTAKRLGADVHAEATPHHFTLTEEAVLKYGTNARMNPPLRTEKDRLKIIEGLQDGTIDMIVTDHAPHTYEEKARPLPQAPSGIIGLETSLSLGIQSLVNEGHLTMMELIKLMSTNPARFAHTEAPSIAPGNRADLVLLAAEEDWTVDGFASKASNSPFIGWTLPGRIHMTICDGRIVYEG